MVVLDHPILREVIFGVKTMDRLSVSRGVLNTSKNTTYLENMVLERDEKSVKRQSYVWSWSLQKKMCSVLNVEESIRSIPDIYKENKKKTLKRSYVFYT